MTGLREAFDEIVADVPVYGDLDRAIEQADRERRQRYGVVAGLAAAAAAVVMTVGVLAVTSDGNNSPQPIGPATPTSTPTGTTPETTAPVTPMANGRLASAERHFARALDPCFVLLPDGEQSILDIRDWVAQGGGDCMIGVRDVDVASGIGVFHESAPADTYDKPNRNTVLVATRDAVVARFRCPSECSGNPALGPGSDEISLPDGHAIKVVGFDGGVRRSFDLSAVFAPSEGSVASVEWSPDRTRAAVVTGHAGEKRIWILDQDGGLPQLVYTATNTERIPARSTPLVYIWSLTWSPDGSTLGFIEEMAYIGHYEEVLSRRAVSLSLPGSGSAVPRTLYEYRPTVYDVAALVWSPDGTRVALKVPGRVLELSAEDGRTLARHPPIEGTLIWPPRKR